MQPERLLEKKSVERIPLLKPDLPPYRAVQSHFRKIFELNIVSNFGRYMNEFEEKAGTYLGTNVAAVSSGTLGIVFALQALGLRPEQKVILPSFSFMATAQAVIYAGGIPLFAEVESDFTLSPLDLEALLSRHPDVGAVLPVHLFGMPCRIDEIQRIVDAASQKNNGRPIPILYDAAHAFGSVSAGVRVGNFGNAEVFSLSATKILTTIEGGLVSSSDTGLIDRICKMRNYGMEAYSYNASLAGLNGKMSEFHASVGIENLKRIDAILEQRRKKADYFLKKIRENTTFHALPVPPKVQHNFKYFTILVPENLREKRDSITAFLRERGVDTRTYFYPSIHEQKFFKRFSLRPLPKTEDLSRRVITLPFFTSLTKAEMDYIVKVLSEAERVFG